MDLRKIREQATQRLSEEKGIVSAFEAAAFEIEGVMALAAASNFEVPKSREETLRLINRWIMEAHTVVFRSAEEHRAESHRIEGEIRAYDNLGRDENPVAQIIDFQPRTER